MSELPCKYTFTFNFSNPIDLQDILLPECFNLLRTEENLVRGVQIIVEETETEACVIANDKMKKLAYLLSLRGHQINFKRGGYSSNGSNGFKVYPESAPVNMSAKVCFFNGDKPPTDFTKGLSIQGKDALSQLSHFQKGCKSLDPIERFREFYLVIEQESQPTFSEEALRHAVNHPVITNTKWRPEVVRLLGSNNFNPTDERQVLIIAQYSKELEIKARKLLQNKFSL